MPIGLIDQASYSDHEIRLHPGDRVLLYTDGFTESVLADGTMLDEAGLLALIQTIPAGAKGPDFLDALYSRLKRKTRAGQEYDDDISAALLEYGIA